MALTIRHEKYSLEPKQWSRSKIIDPQYKTKAWIDYSYTLRATTLMCAISKRPYASKHLVVDHIIPVNEDGSFWDPRNHQVISIWQHNKKTASERNGCKTPFTYNEDGEKIPMK